MLDYDARRDLIPTGCAPSVAVPLMSKKGKCLVRRVGTVRQSTLGLGFRSHAKNRTGTAHGTEIMEIVLHIPFYILKLNLLHFSYKSNTITYDYTA